MYQTQLDEIIPGLFISDWKSAEDYSLLMKNNIKAIITIETRFKNQTVLDFYNMHQIKWMYIYAADSPEEPISRYFDVTADFIRDNLNRGNVLIHCWAGVSRSATILLNYLIRELIRNNNVTDAYAMTILQYNLRLAKKGRSIINPNYGFINQLYLKTLKYLLEKR